MLVTVKAAAAAIAVVPRATKDDFLRKAATALRVETDALIAANGVDVARARAAGMAAALVDRLTLTPARIASMAKGLEDLAALPDPVGETTAQWTSGDGLKIRKVRAPLGAILVVYEARPNVTVDSAGLCVKSGNAVVLRGGSDAIASNRALADVMVRAAHETGLPEGAVTFIDTPDRAVLGELIAATGYLDLVIPRGGEGLKNFLVAHSKVPVVYAAGGNCHVYVDAGADLAMALLIVVNAKVQRPGVCNAAETLLVHEAVAQAFLPQVVRALTELGVTLYLNERALSIVGPQPGIEPATDEHFAREFLDLQMAVGVVDSAAAAIDHINHYGTRHSEAIVTGDAVAAAAFTSKVDAACVYVNASTRFTDGGVFGFGAEIGISTQKLHARGPIGLPQLTCERYIIEGEGQVRK
jgi:glutamate-5-semialdehyde dehydrogenase